MPPLPAFAGGADQRGCAAVAADTTGRNALATSAAGPADATQ